MALSLGKRTWNTLWFPVRAWGTALFWSLDAVNTVATLPKQAGEIISNTTKQLKDVFSNARNKWKRYNKIVNVPLSPLVGIWTAVEWIVRSVVNPTWNAITNTRDVAWNLLVNSWNSIKWVLSDKPVSDFKYEHLKTSEVSTKNYISNRQWFSSWGKKGEAKKEEKSHDDKSEDKPKAESKWPDAETKLKIRTLEAENKKLQATIEKLLRQQEATNEKLEKLLSAKKNEWWKIVKSDAAAKPPKDNTETDEDSEGKIIKWDFTKKPKDKGPDDWGPERQTIKWDFTKKPQLGHEELKNVS